MAKTITFWKEQEKEPSEARARAEFESRAQKLRQERDEALRENWVLQQREQAALPEQMAAAGINGGASESMIANLNAKYQDGRNDIHGDFLNSLDELSAKNSENAAENERKYNEQWLEYLLSLAKMEEEYNKKHGL